ncbi:pseudouridine synthase [Aaosphaeria arxii CBS 175.79]|uniref:tRNA pseudouridine(55) synthase n=1 Tax=Aaosphaeria arxii CBS 175.79 TaxID=1450172 RepID=A0A6A5XRB9_9PLEO|nr:pseudouridine synthase [Aaosphaeria arxii CBS 175.79]KAF2015240.1 pseudouridine synthase [Aaosphaeria arxii CBS 175.79]
MAENEQVVLEGIFGVFKPATTSTPQVLLDLQKIFASSRTFAPLLEETRRKRFEQDLHQRDDQKCKNKEGEGRFFKMGHGGTLDPLASGVLIVGIGAGTKELPNYLACSKTYETVILFGKSTDTYDVDGSITEEAGWSHVTAELLESQLEQFRGTIKQMPPVYSALKINGIKACEYIRSGLPLPRELASREVHVEECSLIEWMDAGTHSYRWPGSTENAMAPAARILLTVSSGFYVRSFVHDLGIACGSLATMAALLRSRQAVFSIPGHGTSAESIPTISYDDLNAGENVWGSLVTEQITKWKDLQVSTEKPERKQRFRGEWLARTRQERIKQQGGKTKGKYNKKRSEKADELNQKPLTS